jgi:excisionase family DNA binding protein
VCSGIVFIAGLVLLFRGEVRMFKRTVPTQATRAIALILMTPVVVGACFGLMTLQVNEEGALDPASAGPAVIVEMIALVIALGLAGYLIAKLPEDTTESIDAQPASAPKQPPQPTPSNQPFPGMAASLPNIMTPAEAATYLNVSEATVRDLINESKLGAANIGGDYRIAKRALDDYLADDVFGDVADGE